MTPDLFTSKESPTPRIPLPGGELRFVGDFLPAHAADDHNNGLLRDTPWREEQVFVWGKWHKQPRLIAWYGDPNASYKYSGRALTPLAWTPRLLELRHAIERECDTAFNSVLLNYYRNGNDSMGWHSDNEPELGRRPIIGSLSLGATRELLLKHRLDKSIGTQRIPLTHGSLLIMSGDTQQNWLHAINKDPRETAGRVNLTFRLINPKRRC